MTFQKHGFGVPRSRSHANYGNHAKTVRRRLTRAATSPSAEPTPSMEVCKPVFLPSRTTPNLRGTWLGKGICRRSRLKKARLIVYRSCLLLYRVPVRSPRTVRPRSQGKIRPVQLAGPEALDQTTLSGQRHPFRKCPCAGA